MNTTNNMQALTNLTEQVIASDILVSAKSGIKNYAAALAETASPQVREMLRRQLDAQIMIHEKISKYMMDKGYYHAYQPQEQIRLDMQTAQNVINLQP